MAEFICAFDGCANRDPHGHGVSGTYPWTWWPDVQPARVPESIIPCACGPEARTVLTAGLRQRAACRAKDVAGIDRGLVDLIAALDAYEAALTQRGDAQ